MLAIMRAGRGGDEALDEFACHIDVHRVLVEMVALAMIRNPDRIQALLTSLGRRPDWGTGVHLQLFLLNLGELLPRRGHQRGVNNMDARWDEAIRDQFYGDPIEDSLGPGLVNLAHEGQTRAPIKNVGGQGQITETLIAYPAQQCVLHLLTGQVYSRYQIRCRSMVPVGDGGLPSCWLTVRGAMWPTFAPKATKSMHDTLSVWGSPNLAIFSLRWVSENLAVLMALRRVIGDKLGWKQVGRILPGWRPAWHFRGAHI